MNIVADEGVDAPIVVRLRREGYQVWYVAELAPSISDDEVFALANQHDAILLTADKDFGAIVFQQRRVTAGVVLLRLHGETLAQKAERVAVIFAEYAEELGHAFTVLTPDRIRIRPQPGESP
jgi:predicted nuclease of predicted toxin-antitoxin system